MTFTQIAVLTIIGGLIAFAVAGCILGAGAVS